MRITISQSRGQIDDPEANYAKVKMVVGNVDADIFVFPEMFMCGYVSKPEKLHLKLVEGRVKDKFKEYSKKRDCAIICGGPMSEDGKVYNSAYFINGDDVRSYGKMHLPSDGMVNEKNLYAQGKGPMIIEHKGMKFGLAISYDLFFPELFRYYAMNDVDMVICISAVPEKTMNDLEKLISARAVENHIHIIFVNMIGNDPGEVMIGRSRWVSPEGNIIEMLTESSDVRQLRINDDEVKDSKNRRSMLKDIRKDVNW